MIKDAALISVFAVSMNHNVPAWRGTGGGMAFGCELVIRSKEVYPCTITNKQQQHTKNLCWGRRVRVAFDCIGHFQVDT